MRLGVGAWKDGRTESIGVKCQGILSNPVSGNHHPAPVTLYDNTVEMNTLGTYHEGRGRVGQNSKKASKGENTTDCTMCHRNQSSTKVKPYHLPGTPPRSWAPMEKTIARIVLILTTPKLHLTTLGSATMNIYQKNHQLKRVVQYSDKFMHGIVLYYIHLTVD